MHFFAELREGLWISWDAIRANKMRSTLTTLGIIIGIVTVTLMGTAINGLNRAFLSSISMLGTDVLYVTRIDWFIESHEEWMRVSRRRQIDYDQFRALERQLTLARAIAPMVDTQQSVKFKNRKSDSVTIIGTTDQMLYTGGATLAEGRFLSAEESEGARPVCVVGYQVATNLFVTDPALGSRIRVGGSTFEVIGVLASQGQFLGAFSLDNQVLLPLKQFMTEFWHDPDLQIQIKAPSLPLLEETREEVRGALRKIRHVPPGAEDDFAIEQQDSFIRTFNRVAGTIAAVGLFITGLSLFVGGIGIMNIMFVSVAERTREIGIRKAIGAKRRAILIQFLTEAACLCLLGGLIALAIAWALTFAVSQILPATMSPSIVGIALLVSILTGVLSGFLPAWRAARMNPVDALRNE
jgi:putative ABC transport system permease protein